MAGNRRNPWVVRVTIGNDDKGRPARKVVGYYPDQQTARAALMEYNDAPTQIPQMMLGQLYADWSDRKYKDLADKTVQGYKTAWKRIEPLWDVKIRDIKTERMQRIVDKAVSDGMSYSTANNIRCLFSMLMERAMQLDVVKKDYSQFIEMPKRKESTKDRFSDLELAKIEQAARDGVPYADCVLMLCYTGFRINEFLSLTRFSYDRENDTLTGGIKTEAGKNRIVPVHPKIKPYLLCWIAKNGRTIVCRENGRAFSDRDFRDKHYLPALYMIGVRPLKPQKCRDTFASLLDNTGSAEMTIAGLLGHVDYTTSKKNYIVKTLKDFRAAIEKIP